VAGEPCGYGQAGSEDRSNLTWPLTTAVVPIQPESQGVLDLRRSWSGEATTTEPHARIRGQAVDVVAGEPGVCDRVEAGLDSEVEL
jgi:hypothetical protein